MQAQKLDHTSSAAAALAVSCPEACGILLDGGKTCVSCAGRWILTHCTTREVLLGRTFVHQFLDSSANGWEAIAEELCGVSG